MSTGKPSESELDQMLLGKRARTMQATAKPKNGMGLAGIWTGFSTRLKWSIDLFQHVQIKPKQRHQSDSSHLNFGSTRFLGPQKLSQHVSTAAGGSSIYGAGCTKGCTYALWEWKDMSETSSMSAHGSHIYIYIFIICRQPAHIVAVKHGWTGVFCWF